MQSALDVRWCADADISAVLFLRSSEEIPGAAAWLRRDDAVAFETLVLETDDDDKSTESWQKVNEVLPKLLTFLIEKIKVILLCYLTVSICNHVISFRFRWCFLFRRPATAIF